MIIYDSSQLDKYMPIIGKINYGNELYKFTNIFNKYWTET